MTEARVIGGGAQSSVWNQIKANVLGVPYLRLSRSEFGTWGSAMIAGKAAGIYDDLAEIAYSHAAAAGPPAKPDQETQNQYKKNVENYIELQESLARTFRGIV